jgi:hypothetical protein
MGGGGILFSEDDANRYPAVTSPSIYIPKQLEGLDQINVTNLLANNSTCSKEIITTRKSHVSQKD